ncbi:hypothetical protein XENOCAPTIV_018320 [Xenoophorus captivus]|uniref:Uncharacterized protein n=1 Tax=Xenoophorus captivus TaxID=1517983 RepID=A0ABV0QIV5_9TELE
MLYVGLSHKIPIKYIARVCNETKHEKFKLCEYADHICLFRAEVTHDFGQADCYSHHSACQFKIKLITLKHSSICRRLLVHTHSPLRGRRWMKSSSISLKQCLTLGSVWSFSVCSFVIC